jgi:hypothetical protein
MTDTPDEPNWSLLPHDPVGFFGLSEGFDRRELRRSYNQLIRRFKPERFPQEFQRIRAAFEQLDGGIRYGQQIQWTSSADEYHWQHDAQSSPPIGRSAPTPPGNAKPDRGRARAALQDRLQHESPADIYRELVARQIKNPFDYYALAVMSDVVDRKDGLQFARWLLQGLADHENDIGLLHMLHAYLRGPIADDACEKLLAACAKIVREDSFFLLTEPLWRLLLQSGDFARFRRALEQCEASLKGVSIDGRIAFYLQILKPAMWIADEAWIEQSLNFIETNFERIPPFLDFDVEMVARLRAYIRHRQTFAQGCPLLQQLDRAMHDYFNEEQLIGDKSVLGCQVAITSNTAELAAAFSELGSPAYLAFYAVWSWVSHDVAERHSEPPSETLDPAIWQSRVVPLLQQLNRQVNNSRIGVGWALSKIGYLILLCAIYFAPILLCTLVLTMLTISVGGVGTILAVAFLSIAAGGYVGHQIAKWFRAKIWRPFELRVTARLYREMWRPELINFLGRSHLPYQIYRNLFWPYSQPGTHSGWINHYMDQDIALPVYAIAQQFMV